MLLTVRHVTRYSYSELLNYSIQHLRLTPQDGFGQRVMAWDLRVNGHLHGYDDVHGNRSHTLVIDSPHSEVSIVATGQIETDLDSPSAESSLPLAVYLRQTALTMPDVSLENFAGRFAGKDVTSKVLECMMMEIIQRVPYARGSTSVQTIAAEAFRLRTGVCQDHAHIFIACCRSMGIPARYVSGYLFTRDGSLMESHAWADAWLPDEGWQSFDVSNGCRANGVHVRLATGLDYRDACPVSGMRIGGGLETMSVSVQMGQMQQSQQ